MRKLITTLLLAAITLHMLLGVWWLAMLLAVLLLGGWLGLAKSRAAARFRSLQWVAYPSLLLGVLALGISMQTLMFGVCYIPSGSMEQTIGQGDRVWVSKLSYGPRLPESVYQIPWLNVVCWLVQGPDTGWGYHRLAGYGSPQRNHVVVFNPPQGGTPFIKRCVALPGDTVQITNGVVTVNGKPIEEQEGVSRRYELTLASGTSSASVLGLAGVNSPMVRLTDSTLTVVLTRSQQQRVAAHPGVLAVNVVVALPDSSQSIFPPSRRGQWGVDSYGPLVIPYSGMLIRLDSTNLLTYGKLIERYEGTAYPDSLFTFSNGYYFMMGDNRHGSNDSRHFGPIPHSSIEGRAILIIHSNGRLGWFTSRLL